MTGTQRLEDNPYREESEPYWHLGLLGEITLGRASWFINFENLLTVRQTREDPVVRPTRAPSGQWTTDIWSRNDGFVVNGDVHLTASQYRRSPVRAVLKMHQVIQSRAPSPRHL